MDTTEARTIAKALCHSGKSRITMQERLAIMVLIDELTYINEQVTSIISKLETSNASGKMQQVSQDGS